jgi:hypothetical protein
MDGWMGKWMNKRGVQIRSPKWMKRVGKKKGNPMDEWHE